MVKMKGFKLDLTSDIDMHQFIQKGMRGGISYISQRYGKTNDKNMKSYDKDKPSKCITWRCR